MIIGVGIDDVDIDRFARSTDDHLLLQEHPHTYTLGVRADLANVLVPPASVGAELVKVRRGGGSGGRSPPAGGLGGFPPGMRRRGRGTSRRGRLSASAASTEQVPRNGASAASE